MSLDYEWIYKERVLSYKNRFRLNNLINDSIIPLHLKAQMQKKSHEQTSTLKVNSLESRRLVNDSWEKNKINIKNKIILDENVVNTTNE